MGHILILIDSRVGSKEIAAYLPNGSYQLTYLDAGDVAFLSNGPDGHMTYPKVIERKRVYDLLDSFKTGRLNSQIEKMLPNYKQIYLIVEGKFRINKDNQHILVPITIDKKTEWKESKFTYATIDNYLNTLTSEVHIQVKRSWDLQETAWQIWDIYTHSNTEKHASHLKLDTTWEINPFMPASFEKRIAAQLDGVGNTKAEAAVAYFKSARDMANATEEQWQKIAGIGPLTSKKIVAQWNNQKI